MTHPGAAGPKPNDGVLRRDRKEERQAQNRSHVKTKAAVGATWPPVQGRLEPQTLRDARRSIPKNMALGHVDVTLLVPRTAAGRMSAL